MTNQEKLNKIIEFLTNQDIFEAIGVDNINHDPHIFVIGPKHVKYAADNCGGMLGQETLDAIPCARCGWPHDRHTSDNVCFLKLKRNCVHAEAQVILKSMIEHLGENSIDGFVFVESKDKFRIN